QAAGPGLALKHSSRAIALADFDDDGDWDVLVTNIDRSPNLLENRSEHGSWLRIELVGRRPNQRALGARVVLTAGGRRQVREVRGDGSYLSHSDPRPLFGIREPAPGASLEVRWPDGRVQKAIPVPGWNRNLRIPYPADPPQKPPDAPGPSPGPGS
ncbi:MAG: ASPIC/UnbV domain-containing protein, partial [Acidobacteriota bacterium]